MNGNPADARRLRRAARVVSLQIAGAALLLVLITLAGALLFVISHLEPNHGDQHESTIDIGVSDLLVAGVLIGVTATAVAGVLTWFATRRAVAPLASALSAQRVFVADAAHELRTPLTVLSTRIQTLSRSSDPETDRGTIEALRDDTAVMADIIADLLATAQDSTSASAPAALSEILRRSIDAMSVLADDRSISIHLTSDTDADTPAPVRVHRAVTALLDNAIAHSPDGGRIDVVLTDHAGASILTVTDQGGGIRGIDPDRVFERFARGSDDARSGTGGAGIGLSLVRDTALRLGGDVSIAWTGAEGTCFRLRLPHP